jgi:serine/threonine protein kinase
MKIGPYEVLGELGRGGLGIVYRVRTPDGSEAALKVLQRVDPERLARFERERRLLASLGEEEGFVGLLDSGVSAETAWLVMPYVPGGTLRQRLDRGALGVEETIALGLELARALGAAHERGIVHRDVKPENVLFTAEGRPLVADLGLAKHFDPAASGASQSVQLTARGAFKGTAGYMAPEQLDDAATVGPPADVFALGAMLYACLAGRPAFAGQTVLEALAKVSSGTVEPIARAEVPPWLEAVVLRALARDPSERYGNGATFARALRGVRETPSLARPVAREPVVTSHVRSLALGGALGALVLVLGIAAFSQVTRVPAPEARPPVPRETAGGRGT